MMIADLHQSANLSLDQSIEGPQQRGPTSVPVHILDVFAREPLSPDHPLTRLSNVVLTPHVGGKVEENLTATVRHVMENRRRHAAGKPPPVVDVVDRP